MVTQKKKPPNWQFKNHFSGISLIKSNKFSYFKADVRN